jgi:hypothetical protein
MSRLPILVLWLAVIAALVGVWWVGRELGGWHAAPAGTPVTTPRKAFLPGPQGDGWKVVHQLSAHHVLVLEVETTRVQEAAAIAQQLAEPVHDRYSEIMVYFYRPGRRGGAPATRVQWTPKGGYLETTYDMP